LLVFFPVIFILFIPFLTVIAFKNYQKFGNSVSIKNMKERKKIRKCSWLLKLGIFLFGLIFGILILIPTYAITLFCIYLDIRSRSKRKSRKVRQIWI